MWILSLTVIQWPLQASADESLTTSHPRPKIALVLAGGGAKGAAHIGVLKALEEMHIPVDYVTGTSMGAYVAGFYAIGMNASEIEGLVNGIDWNSGYRDRVDRSDRRVKDKEYEDRYQLKTDLGFGWNELRSAKGVVQGQNMLRILRESTGNLPYFNSFNDLVIPYRAVATDIVKLKPVVLGQGYLVDAMMASMSVPGALPPYELDGQLLVDGGVTNNMPVDVARQMGADVVIAVDISTDYKSEEGLSTVLSVADQLSNYLVRSSTQDQAEALTSKDVFIQPDVGRMETTEFNKMPQAFIKGYQAAMASKAELMKLSLSSADYQRYLDKKEELRKQMEFGDKLTVDKIVINNQTHYTDTLLDNRLALKPGKKLTTEEIEQSVQNLYALDRFQLITYEYEKEGDENVLVINVKEKSWGPNYANFRFFVEDDFDKAGQYSIGASTNFTDLNSHGAEFRLNLEIGTDKLLSGELFSPVYSGEKTFYSASLALSNVRRDIPESGFDDTDLSATRNYLPIKYEEVRGELALGYQKTLWSELKGGIHYTKGEATVSNFPSYGNVDYTRLGLFTSYKIDTLDDFNLPQKGVYVNLEYLASQDDVDAGNEEDTSNDLTHEISAKLKGAYTVGRHTITGNLDYGIVKSKNTSFPITPKAIGGFLNLSGISRNSLIGQNKAFTSLVYRYRWFDNDFGLFSSPVYLGASIEYGGVWSDPRLDISTAPMYVAGSVFTGVASPIGPIMLGYGRTEQNYDSVYLIIGTAFK